MNFSKPVLVLALSMGIIMTLAYFVVSPESCERDISCVNLFSELQKVIIFLGILFIGFMIFISVLIGSNLQSDKTSQSFTGVMQK